MTMFNLSIYGKDTPTSFPGSLILSPGKMRDPGNEVEGSQAANK